MNVKVEEKDGVIILSPDGRIDSLTSEKFSEVMNEAVKEEKDMIVDFSDVLYISSSGLRVLLAGRKELDNSHSFKIINVTNPIMEIFTITGFDVMFEVERKDEVSGEDIKALFFDVDGTLVDSKVGKVPDSASHPHGTYWYDRR